MVINGHQISTHCVGRSKTLNAIPLVPFKSNHCIFSPIALFSSMCLQKPSHFKFVLASLLHTLGGVEA